MEFDLDKAADELTSIRFQISWVNEQLNRCSKKRATELKQRLAFENRRLAEWDKTYKYLINEL